MVHTYVAFSMPPGYRVDRIRSPPAEMDHFRNSRQLPPLLPRPPHRQHCPFPSHLPHESAHFTHTSLCIVDSHADHLLMMELDSEEAKVPHPMRPQVPMMQN